MSKLLNGKINEYGVIVPLNDTMDIIYNKAENSLLYRKYKSGRVEATIKLAEFDDGQAACSSNVQVPSAGYGGMQRCDFCGLAGRAKSGLPGNCSFGW